MLTIHYATEQKSSRPLFLFIIFLFISICTISSTAIAQHKTVPVDPIATYLLESVYDNYITPQRSSVPISLNSLGFQPGDKVLFHELGLWAPTYGATDWVSGIIAVFSSTSDLLPYTSRYRVPGALYCDAPRYLTPNTFYQNLPTDIPQDFHFGYPEGDVVVTIPQGAKYIFFSVQSSAYNDNSTQSLAADMRAIPIISTPTDGAKPNSNYVALTGRGKGNGKVLLRDGGDFLAVVDINANGDWERLVYLGSGPHSITAEDFDDSILKSPPTMVIPNPGTVPAPHVFVDYTKLKTIDVILTRSNASHQLDLYGPQYTHAALYLGGDSNGTPLIAEAIPSGESRGLGQVRTVPLEWSTVYTDGDFVDFFRSKSVLSDSQKNAVINWTLATTRRGLPYWTYADIGGILWPYHWWSPIFHQPQARNVTWFNQAVANLYNLKRSTNKYICSTLVWQAYMQVGIDLSTPNNARIAGILSGLDPAYVDRIRPYFVFPDTILFCGKLEQVF